MAAFEVVMATPAIIDAVVADVRQADVDELWAVAQVTPRSAIAYGAEHSTAFALLADGVPVCVFGIVPYSVLSGAGIPWMVGTPGIDRHAVGFIRRCRMDLARFFGEWDKLFNVVDARNTKAIRWLKWLGFSVSDPTPYGPLGLLFCPFYMEPHHV